MALRDQPYLPLYIQDFLTDEKLMECSASSTGVYIRIMCIMHKSEVYGKILLKQKDKQTDKQINNFALKVAKHMPYSFDIVLSAIEELLQEGVIQIDGDNLVQKRMFLDGELSITRSNSGSKGGLETQKKIRNFAKAKNISNTEVEDVNIDTVLNNNSNEILEKMIVIEMAKIWMKHNTTYQMQKEVDYPALLGIAYRIADVKGYTKHEVTNGKLQLVCGSWEKIVTFIKNDKFYRKLELETVLKKWTGLVQTMTAEQNPLVEKQADPTKVKINLPG
jgi:uncharacterized protein YdaU (DUF1376 family)